MSHADIEEVAGINTGRVVVVVLRAGSGDANEGRAVHGRRAQAVGTDWGGGCRMHTPAVEPALKLLIGREGGGIDDCGTCGRAASASFASGAGHRARHQAAVETPVEAQPREVLLRLV